MAIFLSWVASHMAHSQVSHFEVLIVKAVTEFPLINCQVH